MTPIVLVLTLILMFCSIALVTVIILQSGRTANAGAVTGAAGNYMSKNKSNSNELKKKTLTVVISIVFIVAVVIVNIIEIV
ncbi:MAG: preprotein translocase subunit SecG [Clostridia bacterium]|nr:preprotein translocase subunit SecG [Clostridia bacterium]